MERCFTNRRTFLQNSVITAVTVAFTGAVTQSRASVQSSKTLRLGGPSFSSSDDPEELARAHRKLGYRAAYCPNLPLKESARIKAYADAFAQQDVVIAE